MKDEFVALRTVKDVVNRYQSIDDIPVTRHLIHQYRGEYAAYIADLAACKEKAKVSEQEKQQRLKQAKESDAVASKKINTKLM